MPVLDAHSHIRGRHGAAMFVNLPAASNTPLPGPIDGGNSVDSPGMRDTLADASPKSATGRVRGGRGVLTTAPTRMMTTHPADLLERARRLLPTLKERAFETERRLKASGTFWRRA